MTFLMQVLSRHPVMGLILVCRMKFGKGVCCCLGGHSIQNCEGLFPCTAPSSWCRVESPSGAGVAVWAVQCNLALLRLGPHPLRLCGTERGMQSGVPAERDHQTVFSQPSVDQFHFRNRLLERHQSQKKKAEIDTMFVFPPCEGVFFCFLSHGQFSKASQLSCNVFSHEKK